MKKVFSTLMVIVLTFGCLTGCSNKKAFEQAEIVRVLKKYGLEQSDSYLDVYRTNYRSGGRFFITEDEDDAKEIADVNYSMKSVLASKIEEDVDDRYTATSYVLLCSFEDSNDAEEQFVNSVDDLTRTRDAEYGEKNGYQYVCYTLSYDNYDLVYKHAIYLCGNNILIIYCDCHEDGKTGFGNYIFKELGLFEPKAKD